MRCSHHTILFLFTTISLLTTTASTANSTRAPTQIHLSGHIDPSEVFSFVYAPFNVTSDVTSIYALQNYSLKGNNSLDLGVFDPRGTAAIDALTGYSGSRGWSGGFRSNFTVGVNEATPGYNAGPIWPGEWNVVLGPYVVLPEGIDWTVDITLRYDEVNGSQIWRPSLPPMDRDALTVQQIMVAGETEEERWLRGDFHMHSVYSDGAYLPSEQLGNAVKKDLDFAFFSEHNTDSGNNEIGKWIEGSEAEKRGMLVGRAIEVTTRHGHWQAIGLERGQQVEWRYTNMSDGYEQAARQVRGSGALVSINHPFTNCSRCDWTLSWEENDAIEVWNGRWDPADQMAVDKWQSELVKGKKVVAVGGSDAHKFPDQNGLPTSVVRAKGLSQEKIVQGVREGKVYLVEGPGMEIDFRAGPFLVGDVVPGGEPLTFNLEATGFADATACFVSEQGYFHNESLFQGQLTVNASGLKFARVEIRNSTDVLLGLTNPIWLS